MAYSNAQAHPAVSQRQTTDALTNKKNKKVEDKIAGLPDGISSPEDRYARFTWEMSRLIDPKTGKIPENIRFKELAFARAMAQKTEWSTSATWNKRGPSNKGGRTRAFAFDVSNPNIMIAGGVTGGMYRSVDAGQSWTQTTTSAQLHSVTSIAQDRRTGKTNVWYHGTGEYYAIISASITQASGNGIYKSTDAGQSWQLLPSTTSNTPTTLYTNGDFDFVWDIVTDHTDAVNDVVFAAVINGIYRSRDGGATWQAVLGGDTTVPGLAEYTSLTMTPSGILYVAISGQFAHSGLWRSGDKGDTWTQIKPGGFFSNFNRVVIAVTPQDENRLYFLANKGSHQLWKYNYLSGNGSGLGGSWTNLTPNIPKTDCKFFYTFNFGPYSSQDGYDMCMAISPADSNLIMLGGTNVYRSSDGYATSNNTDWIGGYRCDSITPSDYVYPNHHPDQHRFIFSPSDATTLYTASDGGLHKTVDILADSVEWVSLNNGYTTTQFYTCAMEPGETNNNIVVGGLQDNGTFFTNSGDYRQPWEWVFYGDGAYCAINEGRSNYYLSWQSGKTFKFTIADDGTVTGLTRIDPIGGNGFQFINPFILDPANNNQMYLAGGRYVWRNLDLNAIPIIGDEYTAIATGWVRIDVSTVGNPVFDGSIGALGMSKSDNSKLYYGTTGGKLYRLDSLQGGTITKTVLTAANFPSGYLAAISVSDENADDVLVCFSNYGILSIFHSLNGGTTWVNVSGNLEENPDGSGNGPAVLWVSRLELEDSTVYFAGTTIGLYSTSNINGNSTVWSQEGKESIGNVVINMINTRAFDGNVLVATHGNGMYSARYKDYVGIKESQKPVLDVHLYPNPLSSQAVFRFTTSNMGAVVLDVYDIQGKNVNQLLNTSLEAGEHTVNWNGNDAHGNKLAAGTYIGVLQVGKTKATVKLIIY
ncbi:hypothetical protein BH09BAC1_BH09BAC1_03120 [soil metagenome]